MVASLLFWGFANEVTTVDEAKKYYPLFGLGANVALIFSGQYVRFVSALRRSWVPTAGGLDPWGQSLRYLMSAVVVSGAAILGLFRFIQTRVLTDPECMSGTAAKKAKTKTKMGFRESAAFLAKSKYIRNLATLVIAYGMSINIVEVSWKSKLKQAFPNPNDYSEFMGQFSSATGATTLVMMLVGQRIFKFFGWGVAALVTPAVLLATGSIFFGCVALARTFPCTPPLRRAGARACVLMERWACVGSLPVLSGGASQAHSVQRRAHALDRWHAGHHPAHARGLHGRGAERFEQVLQVLPLRPVQGNGLYSPRPRVQDEGQGGRGRDRQPAGQVRWVSPAAGGLAAGRPPRHPAKRRAPRASGRGLPLAPTAEVPPLVCSLPGHHRRSYSPWAPSPPQPRTCSLCSCSSSSCGSRRRDR